MYAHADTQLHLCSNENSIPPFIFQKCEARQTLRLPPLTDLSHRKWLLNFCVVPNTTLGRSLRPVVRGWFNFPEHKQTRTRVRWLRVVHFDPTS